MSEAQMRRISYLRSIVKDRDAEIERLRAALREYVCNCPKNTCKYFPCGEFARAALEEK